MAPVTVSRKNRPGEDSQAPGWTGRFTLTWRILAVNIFAIAFMAGGFFYLDGYRTRMVDARLAETQGQLRLLAFTLDRSSPGTHNSFIGDFAGATGNRIRRYNARGIRTVDSFALGVDQYELRDPADEPWKRHAARFLDRVTDMIVFADRPPNYREPRMDNASAWPELRMAMRSGLPQSKERYAPDRTPMISAAVRLRDGGALLSTSNARDITRIVRAERLRLAFLLALAVLASVLLSLFLARTIVLPLRRLAVAAVRVRLGRAREVTVPRLPYRRDEIGMLARALSDMSHALRRRIDATDAFAADVAHELKNPLASLRSALESLRAVERPDLRAQLMDIADDDVRRLDRLVTDIAEASRMDAQLSRARFEAIDIGNLIERLVLAHEARGLPRGIRLAYARPRIGIATVMGEEQRLVQVIENLLDNAVSFSPDRGLVSIVATQTDEGVLVFVEDEGPGVPEAEREHVFRRFHSVRPAGEQFGRHSGLGLAIARSIIEGHHGTIAIADREDRQTGARFVVRLPSATPPSERASLD